VKAISSAAEFNKAVKAAGSKVGTQALVKFYSTILLPESCPLHVFRKSGSNALECSWRCLVPIFEPEFALNVSLLCAAGGGGLLCDMVRAVQANRTQVRRTVRRSQKGTAPPTVSAFLVPAPSPRPDPNLFACIRSMLFRKAQLL